MRTLVEQPPANRKSFHKDVGLVIQFILFELLLSVNETNEILAQLKKAPRNKTQVAKSVKSILESMIRLSGSHNYDTMRLFSRNFSQGILIKLKNYCAFYVEKVGGTDNYMMEAAERSWIYSLQALDIIHQLHHQGAPKPQEFIALKGIIEKMSHCISSLARQISEVLILYRQNENIIYFILRFHSQLDSIYGEKFCQRLLDKMYPKGKNSIEYYICRRYSQRGFHNQIPHIKRYLSQI